MKAIRNITPVAVLLVAITTMLAAGKPLPARLATVPPSVAHANEGPCSLAILKGPMASRDRAQFQANWLLTSLHRHTYSARLEPSSLMVWGTFQPAQYRISAMPQCQLQRPERTL